MTKTDKQKIQAFKRDFYDNDDSSKAYVFAVLLPYVLTFAFSLIASAIAAGNSEKYAQVVSSVGFLIPFAICSPIVFGAIYFLYTKAFNISWKASTIKNKMDWKDALISVGVAVVAFFGTYTFVNCVNAFLGDVLHYSLATDLAGLPLDNFGWFVLQIVLLAVLPAFCEEILFRGLVLQGLRKNFSDRTAILLSALMFALMHGDLQQLVYPFLIGLILGWIAVRSGNIINSMIVHFVNNFLVVLFAYINFDFAPFANVWWYYIVALVALVATFALIFLLDKFVFKGKNKNDIEKEPVQKPSVFLWVGLAVGVIVLVLRIITKYVG